MPRTALGGWGVLVAMGSPCVYVYSCRRRMPQRVLDRPAIEGEGGSAASPCKTGRPWLGKRWEWEAAGAKPLLQSELGRCGWGVTDSLGLWRGGSGGLPSLKREPSLRGSHQNKGGFSPPVPEWKQLHRAAVGRSDPQPRPSVRQYGREGCWFAVAGVHSCWRDTLRNIANSGPIATSGRTRLLLRGSAFISCTSSVCHPQQPGIPTSSGHPEPRLSRCGAMTTSRTLQWFYCERDVVHLLRLT